MVVSFPPVEPIERKLGEMPWEQVKTHHGLAPRTHAGNPPRSTTCLNFMFHRKVKNSWGDTWGQEGYILLERSDSEEDDGGECGLLIEATYPILEPIPTLDDAEFAVEAIALKVIERAEDFESSATANDCGGGTSDVVFDDGEEEGR